MKGQRLYPSGMAKRIVVVGTGTGVGKTHTSIALLVELARRGERRTGLKPIETGVGEETTDAERLADASDPRPSTPPYRFPDPISPHLAARRAGVVISSGVVAEWARLHEGVWLIVETAGGLLSPLSPRETNLDLIRALAPDDVFLVTRDQLGVLHEVSACVLALRTLLPTCPPPVGVFHAPSVPDASTGTNAAELVSLGVLQRTVSFPRAAPDDPSCLQAAGHALDLVSLR